MVDNITIVNGLPLFRHPSEYIIIENAGGQIFRLTPGLPIPEGFTEKIRDKYWNPCYKQDGTLQEKYWALQRFKKEG